MFKPLWIRAASEKNRSPRPFLADREHTKDMAPGSNMIQEQTLHGSGSKPDQYPFCSHQNSW